MKRRDFLKFALSSSALTYTSAGLLQACSSADEVVVDSNAPNPLRFPTLASGALSASYSTAQIWRGQASNVIRVSGQFAAPTIRLERGSTFSSLFQNGLGEPSIIHWHGINAPADMDGHPRSTIESGQSFAYTFPVTQRAGTYWYHAHPDARTAKQAYMGFAGAFIITDAAEEALGLPNGAYDIPLILQDKRVGKDNAVDYAPSQEDILTGYLGNQIIVNGTANAYLEVEQSRYRMRLVNASNARVVRIGFEDGRSFDVIATDGGLIDAPVAATSLFLSPGERIEILVSFAKDTIGSSVRLRSLPYEFNSSHRGEIYPQGMAMEILDCRVRAASGVEIKPVPATLSSIETLPNPVATRTFALTMDHSKHSGVHMINDRVFEMDRIDETVPFGQVEMWEFQNTADAFHSMHVHGAQFQIVERLYAGPRTAVDLGWKDTVLVYPNETVRILIRFNSYRGLYLLHCHTLEHEDDGMMLNINVA